MDYKPFSCWSTAMSLESRRDGIDQEVLKILQMIPNDTELSGSTCNDVRLSLHRKRVYTKYIVVLSVFRVNESS